MAARVSPLCGFPFVPLAIPRPQANGVDVAAAEIHFLVKGKCSGNKSVWTRTLPSDGCLYQ
jgi:hypothetical protein